MDPLGIDMDVLPSKAILDYCRKVLPWTERVVYDEEDNEYYVFQSDTPKEIFELLDEIQPELDFEVRVYEE